MPIIGVTACKSIDDYLQSVTRTGGDARVLDAKTDAPDRAVAELDGLLLTGGVDVDPARYGEVRRATVSAVDEARDAFELALIEKALARQIPVLGICRGLQILNVAFGGTLYQDLPTENPTSLEHSRTATPICVAHDVWISPDSRLASLMPEKLAEADECAVNSRHHQAVRRLADGFEVSATAPDGVVEGIEHKTLPFCVAVQWHPENFWRTGEFRELFEGFVTACRGKE